MSQHVIETTSQSGKRVHVLMGWDRPLQQFFLVVTDLDATDKEDDEYLYTNLGDSMATRCQDIEYFEGKLSELGINVPEEMLIEVAADQVNNVGNRYVDYTSSAPK